MALAAGRDESTYVDQQAVENDVQTLYRAGAGKIGTVSEICKTTFAPFLDPADMGRTRSPSAGSCYSGPMRICVHSLKPSP